MGNLISPPKDTVVLIPPRINGRGLTEPIEMESPMQIQFGKLFRREVLYDLNSFNNSVGLDVLLSPESPPTVAAHMGMSGSSKTRAVESGHLNLQFSKELSDSVRSLGILSMSQRSGVFGCAMMEGQFLPYENCGWSILASSSAGGVHKIGVRGKHSLIECGVEGNVVFPDLKTRITSGSSQGTMCSTCAAVFQTPSIYGIARLSPHIALGMSSPGQVCISLEGSIPDTDSSYCVSGDYNLWTKRMSLGFSQHLVTHRHVYNPFEEKNVKYIANYVDLAVEAETDLSSAKDSYPTRISAGASWQPNKNILLKMHASMDKGLLATLAVRNWWVPSVLGAVSVGIDGAGQTVFGARFQLSNWVRVVEYGKGTPVAALPKTKALSIVNNKVVQNR